MLDAVQVPIVWLRRVRGQFGHSAYAAGVAAVSVGAAATVWLLIRAAPDALSDLEPPAVPVAAPVGSALLDYAADAVLTAALEEGPVVLASSRVGTVTSVPLAPGGQISDGDTVYTVDGIAVVAYSAESVIYRSLKMGDQGPDVAAAQRLLGELLNVPLAADGEFGAETARAVRTYERMLGLKQPSGVLDPSWFTPLPAEPFNVVEVHIQPGQPAPAAGEVVASAAASPSGLELETDSRGPAGQYEFITQGETVLVYRDEDSPWEISDPEAASRVVQLGERTDTTASVAGRLRLVEGTPGQTVPGAAIITDDSGATCVVLEYQDSVMPIQVEGTSVDGLARIRPTLPPGSRVLLNPFVMVGEVACPSN